MSSFQLNEDYYVVTTKDSMTEKYSLDVFACVCSCNVGRKGGPCQHQASVICKYNLFSFIPHLKYDVNFQKSMKYIATGMVMKDSCVVNVCFFFIFKGYMFYIAVFLCDDENSW